MRYIIKFSFFSDRDRLVRAIFLSFTGHKKFISEKSYNYNILRQYFLLLYH